MGTLEVIYRDGARVVHVTLPVREGGDRIVERIVSMGGSTQPSLSRGLSDRETQVARYVRQGWNNRRIADELGITEGTVKRHVSNILDKFGLESRTQLAIAMGS